MPHNYKKVPPLWHLQELFQLSDQYPTGLAWSINKGKYKIGDSVGTRNKTNGYYFVSIDNESYMVHRIVYYLRTKYSPDNFCIKHNYLNKAKDNRLELKPIHY